jgi:hypothetical protein
MTSIHRALLGGAGALAACSGLAVPAFSDDTPQLAEVVVTAEKRVENVQTVPAVYAASCNGNRTII